MKERITKTIKKEIKYEKNGEMFSLQFTAENISPQYEKEGLIRHLKLLCDDIQETMC